MPVSISNASFSSWLLCHALDMAYFGSHPLLAHKHQQQVLCAFLKRFLNFPKIITLWLVEQQPDLEPALWSSLSLTSSLSRWVSFTGKNALISAVCLQPSRLQERDLVEVSCPNPIIAQALKYWSYHHKHHLDQAHRRSHRTLEGGALPEKGCHGVGGVPGGFIASAFCV